MNVRALILGCLLAITALPALPQGFADLGRAADGFALPRRGAFTFPADHAAHPDFRIEWWYLTASLTGLDGTPYGAQWTLFRTALAPGGGEGWSSPQLWMGHAALTSAEKHVFAEKLGRGGVGQAGVTPAPFKAWIDDWQMISRAAPGDEASPSAMLPAKVRP
jgi:predicted secreted hydrolase